ncbi:MAG: hypothetical protein HW421_4045 [Ignavibacteria bacterium]|nr:hypothetical protein [Ignavibacteria bacterium]
MKKFIIFNIIFIFSIAALFAQSKTYNIYKKCANNNFLRLVSVTINTEETRILLEFNPDEDQDFTLFEPGTNGAFYISDIAKTKRYDLIDIEGIKYGTWRLKGGKEYQCTLIFPPINIKRFNLIEGLCATTGDKVAWNFYNVKLEE